MSVRHSLLIGNIRYIPKYFFFLDLSEILFATLFVNVSRPITHFCISEKIILLLILFSQLYFEVQMKLNTKIIV